MLGIDDLANLSRYILSSSNLLSLKTKKELALN